MIASVKLLYHILFDAKFYLISLVRILISILSNIFLIRGCDSLIETITSTRLKSKVTSQGAVPMITCRKIYRHGQTVENQYPCRTLGR